MACTMWNHCAARRRRPLRSACPASFVETVPLPFPVAGAVRFSGQAQFHPLRFLAGLCRDLTVYEQTRVTEADGHSLRANGHTVTAGQVVFATHYPFVNLPGLYFARLHQSRAYTLALENAAHAGGMYIGAEERDLSVRAAGQLLLLCGEDHRTGENAAGGRYDALRRIAAVLYPGSREVARWSAQDCMTPDGVPYIGRYAESTPDWYVATGYNKWGMSSSMVAACRIADWIAGDAPYAPGIFDPRRFNADTAVEVLQAGRAGAQGAGIAVSYRAGDAGQRAAGGAWRRGRHRNGGESGRLPGTGRLPACRRHALPAHGLSGGVEPG